MFEYDQFTLQIQDDRLEATHQPAKGDTLRKSDKITLSKEWPLVIKTIERLNQGELDETELRLLGESLYNALFPGEISALFERAVRDVRHEKFKRLRVSIAMQVDSEVTSWPIEFLRSPLGWLATDSDLTLSRRLVFDEEFRQGEPNELPLKVLVTVSKPQDFDRVMSARVLEEIAHWSFQTAQQESRATPLRDQMRLANPQVGEESRPGIEIKLLGIVDDYEKEIPGIEYLKKPATFGHLREFAKPSEWRPDVLHFIGHGRYLENEGSLALVNNFTGGVDWCNSDEFTQVVGEIDPRLVVLQTCESARVGTGPGFMSLAAYLVQRSIQAVVAMQFEIQNDYAILFSTEFYKALAQGWQVDAAVQRGRWKIPNDPVENLRWKARHFGTPVLFMLNPYEIIRTSAPASRRLSDRQAAFPQSYQGGYQAGQAPGPSPQAGQGALPKTPEEKAAELYQMAGRAASMGDLISAEFLSKRAQEIQKEQEGTGALRKSMKPSRSPSDLSDTLQTPVPVDED